MDEITKELSAWKENDLYCISIGDVIKTAQLANEIYSGIFIRQPVNYENFDNKNSKIYGIFRMEDLECHCHRDIIVSSIDYTEDYDSDFKYCYPTYTYKDYKFTIKR